MTVTQADRDALADMVKARLTHQHGIQGWIDHIATGIRDNVLTSDNNVELQVVAKHREDAERPYRDLVALVKIAQHWHAFNCPPEGVPYDDLDDLWLDINEFLEEVE